MARHPFSQAARLAVAAVIAALGTTSADAAGGAVVKVGMGVDVKSLDPTQTRVLTDFEVGKHVLQTLVSTDEGLGPRPLLATRWSVSDDGRTWRFTLRKGVRFHDGTPLDAAAVKFNIDRFVDPATGTQFISLLEMVKETRVVDDHTVSITTRYPFSPLLLHLAYPATAISSPAAIRKYGKDYGSHPVGTGPFRFAARKPGEYVDLAAFEGYWGEPPKVAGLRFIPIVEDATRVAALQAGDVHIAVRIPYHEVDRLAGDPKLELIRTDSSRIMFVPINVTRKPLDDVRVRRALNYAVDKKAIAEAIMLGNGKPVDAVVGPGAFGYSPVMRYEYDPARAKALLEEAGVASGLSLDFYYSPGRYTADGEVAEAVAAYLRAVGVNVDMHRMEWSTYLDTIRGKRKGAAHDLALYGWGWASGDAHQGLTALFSRGSPSNASHYGSARVEELLDAQARAADPERRARVIRDLMSVVMADAPWIFLVNQGLVTGVRGNVEGVRIPANEMINLYGVRLGG